MYPQLIRLGPVCVYSYGLMVALGIIAASVVVQRICRKRNLPPEQLIDVIFWAVVGGLLGGRLLYVFLHFSEFSPAPLEFFKLYKGGLVFQGGLVGGTAAGLLAIRYYRLPVFPVLDTLAVGLPLAHALGRIGCFLNGCCYGRPTTGFFGVKFPGNLRYVHPTQLYAAGMLFGLFLWLFSREQRKQFDGQIVALYLIGYGLLRFSLEFLRGDPRPMFGPLSLFQLISIAVCIAGGVLYQQRKRERVSAG